METFHLAVGLWSSGGVLKVVPVALQARCHSLSGSRIRCQAALRVESLDLETLSVRVDRSMGKDRKLKQSKRADPGSWPESD